MSFSGKVKRGVVVVVVVLVVIQVRCCINTFLILFDVPVGMLCFLLISPVPVFFHTPAFVPAFCLLDPHLS